MPSDTIILIIIYTTTGMNNAEVLERVETGYRHRKPYNCPEDLYDWMTKCWNQIPADRPTFEHLHVTFDDFLVSSERSYQEQPK